MKDTTSVPPTSRMNRREFVRLAAAGVSVPALAEAVVSAQQAQSPAKSGIVAATTSPRIKMKVGTQHGDSDPILRACAAFVQLRSVPALSSFGGLFGVSGGVPTEFTSQGV